MASSYQSFGWQRSRHGGVVASIRVRTEPGRELLTYRYRSGGEDWKDESYSVYLDWTACHLGGKHPWFLCPALGCGHRIRDKLGWSRASSTATVRNLRGCTGTPSSV